MADDALRAAMQQAYGWDEGEMRRRRQLGDVCYLALDGTVCVHFSWVSYRRRIITEIGLDVTLNDKNAWVYNCYTAPSHRGRSIYPRALRRILEDVRARGGEWAWIDAPPDNPASCKGIAAVGFSEAAVLERAALGRFITLHRRQTARLTPPGQSFGRLPARWI